MYFDMGLHPCIDICDLNSKKSDRKYLSTGEGGQINKRKHILALKIKFFRYASIS